MMSDRTRRFSATEVGMGATGFETKKKSTHHTNRPIKIFDDPAVIQGYESVPLIEIDALPRGGISLETAAVGRIQVRICLH